MFSRWLPAVRALFRRSSLVGRPPWPALVALIMAVTALVGADPYPPYWGANPTPVHFAPVDWPAADADWHPYTRLSSDINDKSVGDPSNGGTSPQGYVNVSSGCTDQTLPSIYFAFRDGVLFFRWRVQSAPNTYATGPSPGSFGSSSPWSSALWTVLVDTDGDGYRNFAVQLDGSSGSPSAQVDRLASIYSATRSQSVDYVGDAANIKLLRHNPTAFVDQPSGRILNFRASKTSPSVLWPNGASETVWDYGTTRTTKFSEPGPCTEYFIDYQIPLGMLDASGVGGPTVTAGTPLALFFSTSNSLTNPLQKDVVLSGDFVADVNSPVPFGDTIVLSGGVMTQPIVRSISASGCGASTQLTASVFDALTTQGATTVAGVEFHRYFDANGNGQADDGGSWTKAADGVNGSTADRWTATWNTTALPKGQYLIGVKATDAQGKVTFSHLTQAQVNAQVGATPPNYGNPAGVGVVTGAFVNSCGTSPVTVGLSVSAAQVNPGAAVSFTVTVTNASASEAVAVTSITNLLPPGFTFVSTGGTLTAPTSGPSAGATGTLAFGFTATTVPPSSSRTLVVNALASAIAGAYSDMASAAVGGSTLSATPVAIGVGSANLTLLNTVSPTSAAPGQSVVYTIAYGNDSSAAASGVVLSDTLPANLGFVSATGSGSYDPGTRTVTWALGSVAAGSGSRSVQVTATIASPFPVGAAALLTNTATLTSPDVSTQTASASLYVNAPRPIFRLQVAGNASQISSGGSVTLTTTYSNAGSGTATGTQIAMPVPAGFTVSNLGGGVLSSGTVTWTIGNVAAGASGAVSLGLTAGGSHTGITAHSATISSPDATPASDTFSLLTTGASGVCYTYYFQATTTSINGVQRNVANGVVPTGTGATNQVLANDTAQTEIARFYQDPAIATSTVLNGNITSTIFLDRNNGVSVDIYGTVYDYDPGTNTSTALGTGTYNYGGSTAGWFTFDVPVSNKTLPKDHRVLWVFTVQMSNTSRDIAVLYGGNANLTVSSPSTVQYADSRATFCTTAPATPSVTMRTNVATVSPGGDVAYTIGFRNAGQTTMTSSTLVHVLPAGLTYQSATLNGLAVGGSPCAGQTCTFTVNSNDTPTSGQITGASSGTLLVTARAASQFAPGAAATLTATASLTSSQTSAVQGSASVTLQAPNITISKHASLSVADPGETVTYTVSLLNGGTGAATTVRLTDTLPVTTGFTYVANSTRLNSGVVAPDPVSGSSLDLTIPSLAAGASATVTYQMLVGSNAPSGLTPTTNTATVTDAQTTGSRSSNATDVTLRTLPALTLTAAASPASVGPGGTVSYSFVVSNTGGGDALNVAVVAGLPSSASYRAGSLAVDSAGKTDESDGDGASVNFPSGRVEFTIGTLAPGQSKTLDYQVSVTPTLPSMSEAISSTATATASNAASINATASATATASALMTVSAMGPSVVPLTTVTANSSGTTVTVASASGFTVGQTVVLGTGASTAERTITAISGQQLTLNAPVSASTGDPVRPPIEYVLTYRNAGDLAATSAKVVGRLDVSAYEPLSIAPSVVPTCDFAGCTFTWTFASVAAGDGGSTRVRIAPNTVGTYGITAAVQEDFTGDTDRVTTAVGALVLQKTTTTPTGSASNGIVSATYVVTATNPLASAAASFSLTDTLPAGFTYASTTGITGSSTPAATSPTLGDERPTWTGLTVPASGQVTITFVARASNLGAGTFNNDASGSSTTYSVIPFDGLTTTAEDVTFAAPLGTTAALSATPSITPGASVAVSLSDIDLDSDPTVAQAVVVSVVNQASGEAESVTLTETGGATGVFTGTMTTVAGSSAPGNGSMGTSVGVTLRASHTDSLTAAGGNVTVTADSAVVSGGAGNTLPVITEGATTAVTMSEDGTPTAFALTLHATDVDNDPLTWSVSAAAAHGTATVTGTGTSKVISYTPAANYAGPDTFTVQVSDGNGGTDTIVVTVTVSPTNNAPVITEGATTAVTMSEDGTPTAFALTLHATDVDNDPLTWSVSGAAAHGTATVTGTGSSKAIGYTPAANYAGPDTFTVQVSDGNGGTDTIVVTVTVSPTNDSPVATADSYSAAAGTPLVVSAAGVLANDTDPEGQALTAIVGTQPAHGTLALNANGSFIYTPVAGYSGTDSFTYTANDAGGGASTPVTVTLTVTNTDAPPVVTGVTVPADGTYRAGQHLDFVVNWSEVVVVDTGGGLTRIAVTLDTGGTVYATYVSGSGTSALVFRLTVSSGQEDLDGITIGSAVLLDSGTIRDATGNSGVTLLNGVGSTQHVLVDAIPPTIAIGAPSVTTTVLGPVTYTVAYVGASSVTLAGGDITLNRTGTANGTVTVSGSGTSARTVTISDITGVGTLGIRVAAGTASDAAGNEAPAAGPSDTFTVVAQPLTLLTPTSGIATGGVAVTIAGSGFSALVDPRVTFGGVAVLTVTVISDTEVHVVTPALTPGSPVDVVINDGGLAVTTLTGAYTPLAPPATENSDADTDADGLPDDWELTHGLDPQDPADADDDPDGDGLTNKEEFERDSHPRGTWKRYFAEGVTYHNMATHLTLFNPGVERTSVLLHFLRDDATTVTHAMSLAGGERAMLNVAAVPGMEAIAFGVEIEASTIIAVESTVTWDATGYGAHSERALEASPRWYFAEGATHPPFDLFFLLLNPTSATADVRVQFLLPAPQAPIERTYQVAPRSRVNVWVDTIPGLESVGLSAAVTSGNDVPIVVERAMYATGDRWWSAGHRAGGTGAAAVQWFVAEGYTSETFDTYLLLGNPGASTALVEVEYLGENGPLFTKTYTAEPFSRVTIPVNDEDPRVASAAFSCRLRSTNGVPFVAERAMWWSDVPGGDWVESHTAGDAPAGAFAWAVADGAAGGAEQAETYLLVSNISSRPGGLHVVLSFDDGTAATRDFPLVAESRFTLDVGAHMPEARGRRFSATLISVGDAPVQIVVERSLYWDVEGVHWAAGVSAPATPLR